MTLLEMLTSPLLWLALLKLTIGAVAILLLSIPFNALVVYPIIQKKMCENNVDYDIKR